MWHRPFLVTLGCFTLAAAACGNVTTREERLAARGLAATAESPATVASTPSGSDTGPAGPAPSEAQGVGAVAPPASSTANGPGGGVSHPRGTAGPSGSAGLPVAGGGTDASRSTPGAPPGPSATPASPVSSGVGQPAAAPTKKSELVFGSFGVEGGPLGTISGPAPAAIRAWLADVNSRGGLGGHPVRVILADDGGDPARTQAIVRQMVEKDHVIAFLYPYAIGTLVPVLPYLEQKGIPVLGQMGAEQAADYSSVVFQPFMGSDKGTAWSFVLAVTAQTDKKKLGIIYCREVQSCAVVKDGIKKLLPYQGLEDVYDAQISLAQPDYTAEMLGAQRAGADVLIIQADVATVNRIAQSAHRQGYRPVLSAPHNLQHQDILAYADELEGLVSYSRIPPYDSPKMADYRRAMSTYQPKAPLGELGGAAFVMGKLLETRIAPLLDDDPTSAEITEAMYTLRQETFGGLLPGVSFPRSKDRSEVNLCAIPTTFREKKFVARDPQESFLCAPGWKPAG